MTTIVDAPARVDGVQLIGEMVGSGYRSPPALARRGDGQTLQLTPLLYLVLEAVDGRRTYDEIAEPSSAALRPERHARTTSRRWSTSSCGRWGCSSGRRLPAGGEEVQPAAGAAAQVRRHRPAERPAG